MKWIKILVLLILLLIAASCTSEGKNEGCIQFLFEEWGIKTAPLMSAADEARNHWFAVFSETTNYEYDSDEWRERMNEEVPLFHTFINKGYEIISYDTDTGMLEVRKRGAQPGVELTTEDKEIIEGVFSDYPTFDVLTIQSCCTQLEANYEGTIMEFIPNVHYGYGSLRENQDQEQALPFIRMSDSVDRFNNILLEMTGDIQIIDAKSGKKLSYIDLCKDQRIEAWTVREGNVLRGQKNAMVYRLVIH